MTRFGFLSTYPPTRCGLATFTQSLSTAMGLAPDAEVRVVRVLDAAESRPAGSPGSGPTRTWRCDRGTGRARNERSPR